jgi:hypothetical protein
MHRPCRACRSGSPSAWRASSRRRPEPALEFIAAHVEGNLLAAHQEIQKLGLLYPPGEISLEQIEAAVLNVARYDVSDLREALKNRDTFAPRARWKASRARMRRRRWCSGPWPPRRAR